jgi:hypothetical protein
MGEPVQYRCQVSQPALSSLPTARAAQQPSRVAHTFKSGNRSEETFEDGQLPVLAGQVRLDRSVLLSTPAREREELLRSYLRSLVASASGLERDTDLPMPAIGIDSAHIVGILRAIRAELAAHVSVLDLASAASLKELAARLDRQIRADTSTAGNGYATGEPCSRWYRWLNGTREQATCPVAAVTLA